MCRQAREAIRREAALIGRFAQYYHGRFADLIDRMNRQPATASDLSCIRLCVEAVDVMLSNQQQLAKALEAMNAPEDRPAPVRRAA